MIPAGYMAKRVCKTPEAMELPEHVIDIYSVGNCVNDHFDEDYSRHWKHNGYWFFDSPGVIQGIAEENSIDLVGTSLFYYEEFEKEFHKGDWRPFGPGFDLPANVVLPTQKRLEGYDVVTFWVENSPAPEHSPLSCNGLAKDVRTNAHCLFDSVEEAEASINKGDFEKGEKGTLRIFAVYSVDWPSSECDLNSSPH
jgi:hypothetical protein